jgi:hypothetical protein
VWDLTPWPLGYYTRMLAGMLCYDEGDELMYGRATPRAWLEPGKSIRVERLQTRFGPTSFALTAGEDGVTGFIELPARRRPREALLRLRLNGTVEALRLNGRAAPFDGETGTARLPRRAGRVAVEARVTWNRGPG